MFLRGSSVSGDRGELERRRRQSACERLERNYVSDGFVTVGLEDEMYQRRPRRQEKVHS